jgi:DNA-binding response OmpR family regulator
MTANKCPCCGSDAKPAPITVDLDGRLLWLGWYQRPIHLRKKQAEILQVLAERLGSTVTLNYIIERLWDCGEDEPEDPRNNVCTHLVGLRKILAPHGVKIETVWNSGYRLTVNQPVAVAHAA